MIWIRIMSKERTPRFHAVDYGFQVLDFKFLLASGTWIPDSNHFQDSRFLESWIPHSIAQDCVFRLCFSVFFCNPDYLTWSERVSLSLTTKRHYEYWQRLLHCKLIRSVCDSFSQLILSSITVVSENSLFDWPCVLVNFLNSILRFWTTFELNCQAPYQSGCRQFCIYIS